MAQDDAHEEVMDRLDELVRSPLKVEILCYYYNNPGVIVTCESLAESLGRPMDLIEKCLPDFVDLGLMKVMTSPVSGAKVIRFLPGSPEFTEVLDKIISHLARVDGIVTRRTFRKHYFQTVVGVDLKMVRVYEMVSTVAKSEATVLLVGETGTGKELMAHAIHDMSLRCEGPFVAVDCAALAEGVIESELFGHEKGAYTGATRQRKGRFEQADGGTIFLDEVTNIPLGVQVKLLRALQEREIERVGESRSIKVDVRVICSTNRPLEALIAEGKFRADLYYRISAIPIELPPLRERKDDIPFLSERLLERISQKNRVGPEEILPRAMELLIRYDWPGNVRELENVIERALVLSKGVSISPEDLPPRLQQRLAEPERPSVLRTLEEVEREHIRAVLAYCRWNQQAAAKILGIHRDTLHRKMERYSIRREDRRMVNEKVA